MTKKALLIIDVQNDMFSDVFPVYNGNKLLENIKFLITKAKETDTPIFYVQHNEPAGQPLEHGTIGWEIHPEIAPNDHAFTVQKETPDSFHKTNLENLLKDLNIDHLILTGIQSDLCVDTTCRRAFSLGYQITLVSDAHSTFDTKDLTAQQIINHHNNTLQFFADIKKADSINFE